MNVPWFNGWDVSLGFIALGAMLIWLSGTLLVEYRKVFFSNPLAVMSIDILAQVLACGAPGYLALFCYGIGAFFLVAGIGIFLFDAMSFVLYLFRMIVLTFSQ